MLGKLQFRQKMHLKMHLQQEFGVAGTERIDVSGVVVEWGTVRSYREKNTGWPVGCMTAWTALAGQNTHLGRFCQVDINS